MTCHKINDTFDLANNLESRYPIPNTLATLSKSVMYMIKLSIDVNKINDNIAINIIINFINIILDTVDIF